MLRLRPIAVCLLLFAACGPAYGQKILAEGIKDLANQIAGQAAKAKKAKLAILPFRDLEGKPTLLSTFIPEELTTDLFAIGGFDIVERAMLDRLVAEVKLGQNGLVEPETAKKLGKLASVDVIVTGSIADFQSYVALNCRMFDAQTGRIFGAAQAKIVKDADLQKVLGGSLQAVSTESAAPAPKPPTDTTRSAAAPIRLRVDDHVFELKRCTRSGVSLDCEILITNQGPDRTLRLYPSSARLIDEDGTGYSAVALTLSGRSSNKVPRVPGYGTTRGNPPAVTDLPTGVPIRASVTFEGIPSDTKRAALIELQEETGGFSGFNGGGLKAQFRNVPLPFP